MDGDGGSGGYRPGAPPDRDPFGPDSDWNRFLAEEDEAERESGDKNRELTFIESIFAFVFGRGDPNEDLEHRRWRAVGLLLRVNKGAVYAEQLAPFLDSYLLRGHQTRKGLASALTGLLTSIKNLRRTRRGGLGQGGFEPDARRVRARGSLAVRRARRELGRRAVGVRVSRAAGVDARGLRGRRRRRLRASTNVAAARSAPDLRTNEAGVGRRREDPARRGPRAREPGDGADVQARRRDGFPRASKAARDPRSAHHGS